MPWQDLHADLEAEFHALSERGDEVADELERRDARRRAQAVDNVRWWRGRRPPRPVVQLVCAHCGAPFATHIKETRTCGTACARAAEKLRAAARRAKQAAALGDEPGCDTNPLRKAAYQC